MSQKITLKNIRNFLLGYGNLIRSNLVGLPQHQQEQVEYRAFLCKNDCAKQGYCTQCGCNYPGRIFTPSSCNKERFPDFMDALDWEDYKMKNNIQ